MNFEEWGKPQHGVVDKVALIRDMYTDWKAEREKLIEALVEVELGFMDVLEAAKNGFPATAREYARVGLVHIRAVLAEIQHKEGE